MNSDRLPDESASITKEDECERADKAAQSQEGYISGRSEVSKYRFIWTS